MAAKCLPREHSQGEDQQDYLHPLQQLKELLKPVKSCSNNFTALHAISARPMLDVQDALLIPTRSGTAMPILYTPLNFDFQHTL